jgi:hypothetical protein
VIDEVGLDVGGLRQQPIRAENIDDHWDARSKRPT